MNLGIAGRKAIVCASSRGLGKACARALAEAGCKVVINGRDAKKLEAAASELSVAGVKVIPVVADVATAEGQKALLAACPQPDILVNNNAGPPMRDFRELTRQQMLDGVVANMVVAIELIQKVIDPMCERKFGRIVNITSGSVKMPLAGLDLSSGARAGLTAFLAGVARKVAEKNVTINQYPARRLRYRPPAQHAEQDRRADRQKRGRGCDRPYGRHTRQTVRQCRRVWRRLCIFVLGAGRLHHRTEPADRRRHLQRRILKCEGRHWLPASHPTPSRCLTS